MRSSGWGSRLVGLALAVSLAGLLAACDDDQFAGGPDRSLTPIPSDTIALMEQKDTTPTSPILIRAYKKEAEFEVWKRKTDGRYTLLKTYPMCRWSGQLGPKKREGDRQVPEGFYTISPGQMNPRSNYYLSFNVGYPNAYDRAFGRTGGDIMVHGICSSAGCFSMTDRQIAEIYAIAREAFNGGEREIQMESFPFRMTAENLAKYRYDPNIAFWRELKKGSDYFEVTKTEPTVGVCDRHYVFDASAKGGFSASGPCPTLARDPSVEAAVAAKEARDDAAVALLVRSGVKPIETVYQDGGQNPAFRNQPDVSRPEAIAEGPLDVIVDEHGKPIPAVVRVAAAQTRPSVRAAGSHAKPAPAKAPATGMLAAAAAPTPDAHPSQTDGSDAKGSPFTTVADVAGSGGAIVKKWLTFGSSKSAASDVKVFEPAQPIPADVPLPPRRNTAEAARPAKLKPQPQASLVGAPHVAAATPSAADLTNLARAMRIASLAKSMVASAQ